MLFNQSASSNTYFTAFSLRANDIKLPAMTKQSQSANAKAKQLHCTHTQTGTELHRVAQKGALTHTQTQAHTEYQTAAHSLTHVHSTSCMLSLRLSLRSARLSLCCLCRCPLLSSSAHSLRLHFIQFFAWLLSLPSRRVAAAAAAALQTPLLLQSTPTIEAHRQARARGEDDRRGKRSECRQNNMFVWIISYVALRCDGDTDDATATRRGDASLCAQTIGAGGSCMATPTVVRHNQQRGREGRE